MGFISAIGIRRRQDKGKVRKFRRRNDWDESTRCSARKLSLSKEQRTKSEGDDNLQRSIPEKKQRTMDGKLASLSKTTRQPKIAKDISSSYITIPT